MGSAAPPQILQNKCRNHLDAAFTDAPTWVQLPSGLWALQFVSAQTNYCTIPDITELLGATAATWMAWVRVDAWVDGASIASDYTASGGLKRWIFGGGTSVDNSFSCYAGDGTTAITLGIASAFTVGWHFCWMRFTGASVTGLESGVDSTVAVPASVAAVAALGTGVKNQTYIGKYSTTYSSMTLAALGISAHALTDEQIAIWREKYRPLIGV
jgi:hypothetical protein